MFFTRLHSRAFSIISDINASPYVCEVVWYSIWNLIYFIKSSQPYLFFGNNLLLFTIYLLCYILVWNSARLTLKILSWLIQNLMSLFLEKCTSYSMHTPFTKCYSSIFFLLGKVSHYTLTIFWDLSVKKVYKIINCTSNAIKDQLFKWKAVSGHKIIDWQILRT